jgi:hypothetical protein
MAKGAEQAAMLIAGLLAKVCAHAPRLDPVPIVAALRVIRASHVIGISFIRLAIGASRGFPHGGQAVLAIAHDS